MIAAVGRDRTLATAAGVTFCVLCFGRGLSPGGRDFRARSVFRGRFGDYQLIIDADDTLDRAKGFLDSLFQVR